MPASKGTLFVYSYINATLLIVPICIGSAIKPSGIAVFARDRVRVANRAVMWCAPFLGDLWIGNGTLLDAGTQTLLANFVLGGGQGTSQFPAGGKLLVTGRDVAWALTQIDVVSVVFRPKPLSPVRDKRVFFCCTASVEAGPRLKDHLERAHGCELVGATHRLADRPARSNACLASGLTMRR